MQGLTWLNYNANKKIIQLIQQILAVLQLDQKYIEEAFFISEERFKFNFSLS